MQTGSQSESKKKITTVALPETTYIALKQRVFETSLNLRRHISISDFVDAAILLFIKLQQENDDKIKKKICDLVDDPKICEFFNLQRTTRF